MICAHCHKPLEGGAYVALDGWPQWHHYTKEQPGANRYCSRECFADDWAVEWLDADELDDLKEG